jgi:hypothetical protein
MVYDTTTSSFWYYNSSAWVQIGVGGNGWSLTGNTGINAASNFIGTTDARELTIKVNNQAVNAPHCVSLLYAEMFRSREFQMQNASFQNLAGLNPKTFP